MNITDSLKRTAVPAVRPIVLLYRCNDCIWYGCDPHWSDNTPLEMRSDGSKPNQSVIAACRGCYGINLRCERVA